MPEVHLAESYYPATHDIPIQNIPIGELLSQTAAVNQNRETIIEITAAGNVGQRW